MDELPAGESPPPSPAVRGEPGWRIRESTAARVDPWLDAMQPPAPPAMPPPPPAVPASPGPPPGAGESRRSLATIGVVGGVIAALTVAVVVVLAGRQSPSATTASSVLTPAAIASPTATAAPPPTPISAAALHAGQEYMAAVTPLNAALNKFGATFNAAMHSSCTCPAGQFDASAALRQINSVVARYTDVKSTLYHMEAELPQLAQDIAAVRSDDDLQMSDFMNADQAYQHNDQAAMSTYLNLVATDQQKAVADIRRLRADLGLPPPAA